MLKLLGIEGLQGVFVFGLQTVQLISSTSKVCLQLTDGTIAKSDLVLEIVVLLLQIRLRIAKLLFVALSKLLGISMQLAQLSSVRFVLLFHFVPQVIQRTPSVVRSGFCLFLACL